MQVLVGSDDDVKMPASLASPRPSIQDHCLVCYSELHHTGITPCGHDHICGVCHLRLRHLHNDKKCPMCKTENERLIVDEPGKLYEEYPMWGDEIGGTYTFREDVGMFFPRDYYEEEILPLFGYSCGVKGCGYNGTTPDENIYENAGEKIKQNKKKHKTPLRQLQDHLRNKHRLTLCQLCVDSKRDFISKLPRFTPNQLKNHQQKGDGPDSGFKGHPVCKFCHPKRFYDLTQLHLHLQKEHYKCHICEKQGKLNQYFRNYQSLERHFDREHFLCHNPQCLMARFVVFENEIDFRAHEMNVHGGTSSGSTKIQLEFQYRRSGHDGSGISQDVPTDQDFDYGLDGQAFVPEAAPQQWDDDVNATIHPLHVARTAEFRARAQVIRQEQNHESHEDAFPALGGAGDDNAAGAGGGLRIGWTQHEGGALRSRQQVGEVTAEAFPSLPQSGRNQSVAAKIRAKPRGGASTTAAAISSASWGGGGGNRATAPMASRSTGVAFPPANSVPRNNQSNLQSSNFPSLGPPSVSRPATIPANSVSRSKQSNLQSSNFPSLGTPSSSRPAATSKAPLTRTAMPPIVTADNYPSLGAPSATRAQYTAAEAYAKKQESARASLSNPDNFPPPPAATIKKSVKEKLMSEKPRGPSQQALSNVLNFPPPSSSSMEQGRASADQIKVSLGQSKYKRLKKLTRECVSNEIEPEAYVDQVASLFDSGFDDADFWSYIPSLLESWPNQAASQRALKYMRERRASSFASSSSSRPLQQQHVASAGKKKNAWNSGTATTVAAAKAGGVSAYAASQGPQTGTATKYMAKMNKPQQQQKKSQKKKKQKDELRSLAFGK